MKRLKPRDPDRTRERLLEAGFREIHRQGFQPASLEAIVDSAGVTKGALYHHFPGKQALGYAVVDEVLGRLLHEHWLGPIEHAADSLDALIATIRKASQSKTVELGCPLNNLAQEMSGVDDGFQQRIAELYRRWEAGVARALQRGQAQGGVRRDVDVAVAATFVVASLAGALPTGTNLETDAHGSSLAWCLGWVGPPDWQERGAPVG
jgi:TetR/AcrR family transcriptional repressor of nem operon